ncbi:acyltransferase family protein [Kitasatospora sp. NPDC006697]|uniref:acyltransferase family protein n=1 Tax=Kitasatospora sp. NPDC006697 TaxID=3364020 RepID=UPI0036C03A83
MSSTVASHEQLPRHTVDSAAPTEAAKPAKRPRLYVLDGLRLLAAIGVLCWHWLGVERFPGVWHGDPKKMMPFGHLIGAYSWTGVQLFFLISGFVICMSCWGRSLGDFVTSRVVRLFPAYWVAVLITSAVLLWWAPTIWGDDTHHPTPTRILSNLTMLNMPGNVDNIDPVYWSLWAEMRFYVLFGVLLLWGLTYRRLVAFCGIWAFLATISPAVNWPLLDTIVQPTYAWYFISGIAMYLMYRFKPNLALWGIIGFCWLMAQDKMRGVIYGYEYGTEHHLSWYLTMAYVTVAYLLVIGAALGWFNWIRWRWLTTAGALTYPLYLLHQEVGFQIITRLRPKMAPYPTFFLTLGIMLVAAYLVHRLVERPLAPWMKKKLDLSFAQIRRNGEPE